jgi:hypothetical protein
MRTADREEIMSCIQSMNKIVGGAVAQQRVKQTVQVSGVSAYYMTSWPALGRIGGGAPRDHYISTYNNKRRVWFAK